MIESRLQNLPAKPGVYLMKNSKDEIIYIGKAKLLNKRVRSYFDGREKGDHRAATLMVAHIKDIEWIITESEAEALILEANLIAKHQPYYNIRQKDDKHYPYLMLTMQEKFPRLRITRHTKDDKNLYYGPFISSYYIRTILDLVPRIFHLRECGYKLPQEKIRPCLNFHIGRCKAPCAEMVSEKEYMKGVMSAKMLLEGKNNEILADIEDEMHNASAEMRFEEAGKLRDQIRAVHNAFAKQKADKANQADLSLDVIAICRAKELATVVIIEYRNGVMCERRHFNLENRLEWDSPEILAEFLPCWYLKIPMEDMPYEIALEISLGEEQETFEELLANRVGRKIPVVVPQRGDKLGYLRIAKANAEMLLVELQAKDAKYHEMNRSIFELQKELNLSSPPFCIECFDISHLGGTEPVASMVRFVNGFPSKSDYRKYMIKVAEGGDDFASMREVLSRRLTRLQKENADFPDLLVIDGGKGQVEAAFDVLKEMNLTNIPVIGLAKRLEEIVFAGKKSSILLKRSNAALQLLQRIRDEAHRFAITFQRKRRKKSLR
ncbi:MAG: excinuclease ABC subunit UvrC [Fibromonadaceae bacterium]|jgi:excinuclease ABC subunit C|nr:excinuclease ABC subunit UvrC [Fibromonadaceae bacterium]